MSYIKDTLTKIYKFIIQYKFTLLTLFYFCLIAFFSLKQNFKPLPILGTLSVFFILNIIAKTKFSYLYAILLSILTTLSAYVAFTYSSYISTSIIAVILGSNVSEIKSAIGGLFLPALGLMILSSFLIISSTKELRQSKVSIKDSILTVLIIISCLSALTFRQILIFNDFREEYNKAPLSIFSRALNRYCPFFYGNITTIASYLYDIYLFNSYANAEKKMPYGITDEGKENQISKIFLIIGESANPEYMSLFGYDKPTTPFLDSIYNTNNSLFKIEARGIASQTKDAVPGIVSSSTPRDLNAYRGEYSLIELAKKKGYTTYWISNQNTSGLWNGRDAISAIAGKADYSYFWDGGTLLDDFTLLDKLDSYYAKDNSKQLFIFHIQGSHFLYKDRYDHLDIEKLPGESTLQIHYDRTIHHTDRFLEKIYKYLVLNESSAMIYLSDHGQEIQEVFGHGVGKATKKQFQTPFVAINNSNYPIDSIASPYIANDSIISNNSVPSILSQAMGYSVSAESIKQTIEEGRYVHHGDDKVYHADELE